MIISLQAAGGCRGKQVDESGIWGLFEPKQWDKKQSWDNSLKVSGFPSFAFIIVHRFPSPPPTFLFSCRSTSHPASEIYTHNANPQRSKRRRERGSWNNRRMWENAKKNINRIEEDGRDNRAFPRGLLQWRVNVNGIWDNGWSVTEREYNDWSSSTISSSDFWWWNINCSDYESASLSKPARCQRYIHSHLHDMLEKLNQVKSADNLLICFMKFPNAAVKFVSHKEKVHKLDGCGSLKQSV